MVVDNVPNIVIDLFSPPTNLKEVKGGKIMIESGVKSKQRHCLAWTQELAL